MSVKKIIYLIPIGLTLWAGYRLLVQGFEYYNFANDKQKLQNEIKSWQDKNALLEQKIESLTPTNKNQKIDIDFLEELARKKLGYGFPKDKVLKDPPADFAP